jgi:16S rRNA (cytosine1402-N4)-methyltransferase
MAVNSELENLKIALPKAFELLKRGGRLVVVSFHSGEDVLVKNFFRNMQKKDLIKILTKKPVVPARGETTKNPRARSAKLRCFEKL